MVLEVKLFGAPAFGGADGTIIQLPTRKSEALLCYLLERKGEGRARKAVSDLLWPLSAEEQSRASLRQEMSVLRKALGPEVAKSIVTKGDRIFAVPDGFDVDVWHLDRLELADTGRQTILPVLDLYAAPFLDTFRIRSKPFSDWVQTTRHTCETKVLELGRTALDQCLELDLPDDIRRIAQHLLRIAPTYEPAHRALIQQHMRSGDAASARRQFDLCRDVLKSELNTDVSQETLRLFENAPTPQGNALARQSPQRRTVTVLSFVANIDLDDPEDYERATAQFFDVVQGHIVAKGGMILRNFGDHVLACFGYPTGHDSDPDTAAFAAQDILRVFNTQNQDTRCQIGLAYGQALVAGGDANAKVPLDISGAVVRSADTASRRSAYGTISVDADAQAMLSPAIRLQAVAGQADIKTIVPRRAPLQVSGHAFLTRANTPFIGRDAQLAELQTALQDAQSGKGSGIAVLGNPGEGKSRLVQETAECAVHLGFDVQVFQGHRSDRQSTFAPVLDQMFRDGAFRSGAITPDALKAWLLQRCPDGVDTSPYFATLLGIALAKDGHVSDAAKQAALDLFAAQARAAQRPVLMIFEDTQWFDQTTLDAILKLLDVIKDTPVLAVVVSRITQAATITQHPRIKQIILEPLPPQNAEMLLRRLLGGLPTPTATISNVLDRAEGNPLVLEEFARSLSYAHAQGGDLAKDDTIAASDHATKGSVETPMRLLPLLLARIDAVPGAIQTLQRATVFGRSFSQSQLAHSLKPQPLDRQMMDNVVDAGILLVDAARADRSFAFKHVLISEAIYSTIPKRDRPSMHITAAETLLRDADHVQFGDVARHFKQGGAFDRAAAYFEKSGDRAAGVSANAEAISEYRQAIKMTEQQASSEQRLRHELSLNRKTAAQFIALRGIPTKDVRDYYIKTQALSRALQDRDEVVNATWGLWSMQLMVADLDYCLKAAQDVTPIIDACHNPASIVIGQYMLGVTHAYRGTLDHACAHLEAALDAHSDGLKPELQLRTGMDIELTANSFLGWVYALQGQRTKADTACQNALQIAKRNNNGLSFVFADVFTATKCLFLGDLDQAQDHAERALAGANRMGFVQWSAQARMQLARVADLRGDFSALADLQTVRREYLATGMVLARAYLDVWIAQAQIRHNDWPAALQTLDALHQYTEKSEQRYFEFAALATRDQIAKMAD